MAIIRGNDNNVYNIPDEELAKYLVAPSASQHDAQVLGEAGLRDGWDYLTPEAAPDLRLSPGPDADAEVQGVHDGWSYIARNASPEV
ncbi:hypothetical protein [Mycobacterium sp. E3339]|uniref:hypothetical protein n=1 Tax=Mycobacterium sp. E3339 TaxID=1834146 RepID=UPI0007FE9E5B|nr:hypothetical protein [Mycobacterium sp. E3339]OBG67857.1 hypothetical protein A5702_14910 [Mycobacterium sp. E3339]